MPAKVPDQRRADESAQDFRRLIERAHGVDDAENRGHDAKRGQSVGDRLERMHRLVPVVRQGLDLLVHQRLDLVRSRVADDDEAAIVADERDQVLVGEQLGKIPEYLGFLRVVEMRFDFAAGLGPELPHQGVEGRQHVEEVAWLGRLVEDRLEARLAAVLDRRCGVGDDEDAERDPAMMTNS